jgi:hypothetical protein
MVKVYKLRHPLENFKKLLIPLLFKSDEDIKYEENSDAKKFIDKAVEAFEDESVKDKAKYKGEIGSWTINYEEVISIIPPMKEYNMNYVSVGIEGGIELDGDIKSNGTIDFDIDHQGMLSAIGYEVEDE